MVPTKQPTKVGTGSAGPEQIRGIRPTDQVEPWLSQDSRCEIVLFLKRVLFANALQMLGLFVVVLDTNLLVFLAI